MASFNWVLSLPLSLSFVCQVGIRQQRPAFELRPSRKRKFNRLPQLNGQDTCFRLGFPMRIFECVICVQLMWMFVIANDSWLGQSETFVPTRHNHNPRSTKKSCLANFSIKNAFWMNSIKYLDEPRRRLSGRCESCRSLLRPKREQASFTYSAVSWRIELALALIW